MFFQCVVTQVKKTSEYDEYCHYVAGLVGIGLSQLFGEILSSAALQTLIRMQVSIFHKPRITGQQRTSAHIQVVE
jgi:phytoene/squalene synthetase